MNDSMQFGPEWLRNLSQHDEENTMVMPKYQLAEHRYGREEMLALFDRSVVAPEPLRSIGGLFVEKFQLPLALIQMSETETRVWNSSGNNEAGQRSMIKSGPSQIPNMSQSGGSLSMSRGRGISVDRGKGRTSRGPYHYNNRNYAEEGTDTTHAGTAFGRPRMFERSQSHNNERTWSERNGNVEYNEWNGYSNNVENGLSTSPRKDFGATMRLTSGSREDTNWRRRPTNKDEDDGWRSNKHGRTGYNWREGGERDREKDKDNEGQETSKDRRWISRISNMHSQPNRYNSENKDDCLPEWATESPSEGGGTFDSSGAFHGGAHSDDDDFIEKDVKSRDDTERSEKKGKGDFCDPDGRERISRPDRKLQTSDQKNRAKEKTSSRRNLESSPPQVVDDVVDPYPVSSPSSSKSTVPKPPIAQHQEAQQHHQLKEPSLSIEEDYYGSVRDRSKETATLELDSRTTSSQQIHQQLQHEAYPQLHSKFLPANSTPSMAGGPFDTGFMSMNPVMVQNVAGGSSPTVTLKNKALITPSDIVNNSIPSMHPKDSIEKTKSTPVMNPLAGLNAFAQRAKAKEEDLDCIVGDVVSKLMADEEEKEKLKKLDGMNKWYYRDPQGQVQGPFPNTEMAEWYKLGYFHDKSLIVRRACENNYYPLHDLVTFLQGSPFETVTLQNFNKYSRVAIPGIQLNPIPNAMQAMPIPTNVPDESLLLSQPQHYQSAYDLLFARQQQQIMAAKKRQQTQEGMKSLFEQQKLLSMSNAVEAGAGPSSSAGSASSPSSIPMIPGFMHPVMPPTVPPSSDPNFVMMLHQQQQLHQHILQQQLQQQQQQQQQQQHHHHHQHPQQQMSQPPIKDVKPDRLQQQQQQPPPPPPPTQPNLMPHLDHPLQQLVHKINNLSTSNQVPLVQAQGCSPSLHSMQPTISGDPIQAEMPTTCGEKMQPTNAIQNLLKQLGVAAEKQSKPVDSIWGASNVPTVPPVLSNTSFNAQQWCSQVGKIGPTNAAAANSGPVRLWMQDNAPPTAAMKTEQEIIESFMKRMQRPQEDAKKDAETKSDLLRKEEQLKLMHAKKKEEEKARLEEEKRRKQEEEEEKLRKLEEEQRRKAVEDAKRKEEERRRKEEEKRRREEEKEQKRKAEEERKRSDEQQLQDLKDMHRKQTEAMKRLKEQQLAAAGASKPSLKSVASLADQQQSQKASKAQKSNASTNAKQLSKSQSGDIVSDVRVASKAATSAGKDSSVDSQSSNQQTSANKQIGKSKSTSSVPTPNQKTVEGEKKSQEKKKKDKNPTNAWADQKKIPQVKSLAEIQAEEQKKLAKQIEREKQERLLQQQQAAANAQAVKEAANINIWKSQNQPWKTTWTTTSLPSTLSNSNDSSQGATNRQSNTASTTNAAATRGGSGKSSATNNTNAASSSKQVPSGKGGETSTSSSAAVAGGNANAKNKTKKEDAVNKKSATSSSSSTAVPQASFKNDELSKWGVKALSSLKVSVDVPTFIGFLREVESPNDVMEYVTDYLGDGKDIKNFVKQFLEKRSGGVWTTSTTAAENAKKSKTKKSSAGEENSSSANKTTKGSSFREKEPVCKTNSAEFVEVKAKSKKSAKKKVLRVDTALLGFNVTAAPNRINIGERDMGEDVY